MALEMRQRGYQIQVTAVPSNIRLAEPITTFLYRAVRSFLRQATGNGISSLISVSVEGKQASIVRVRAAINREVRTSGTEAITLFEQPTEMTCAGIKAGCKLLGIAVTVESSPGTTTTLVLDIPLLGSFEPL